MPTPYIKKLSKQGKGSVESLEKKWDAAKEAASKQGKADNYALVTTIFKSMIGARIEAKSRLRMTENE